MIIPGFLIAIATFPGIIVHEAGHALFCRLRNIDIIEACYLRFANPPGYIIHERAKDFTGSFLITVGPFLLNSIMCMAICLPAMVRVRLFELADPFSYVLLWLGVSIGMHAFPSTQDAGNLWADATVAAKRLNPLAMLSLPLIGIIYLANFGKFFWLDYLYGIGIGVGLPMLLFQRMMS
jgi:hypothetical protein